MTQSRRSLYFLGLAAVTALPLALDAMPRRDQPGPADPPAPFIRIIDADDGTIQLQLAVRTFNPPPAIDGQRGPTVYLAGAVHVADAPFYDDLQKFLDSRDVVLFEGVKPPGAGRGEALATNDDRVRLSEQRLRFLAASSSMYRREHGEPPATVDELAAGMDRRLGGLIEACRDDGWGHPIEVAPLPEAVSKRAPGVDLVSLGADGRPGGDGPDADLRFSDQKPLTAQERGQGDPGIQTQLADALGLVFQKDGMDWTKPNWRNSDLSVDEIMDRLGRSGGSGDALFGILEGGSFAGKLAGMALKFIGMSTTFQTTAKLMVVEMLSQADELLKATPGMDVMMGVIIHDRNAVVIEDLRRLIRDEPQVRTVAIIYGAGHLLDMQERLCSELGYSPAGDEWRAAITVDPKKAGITDRQARDMRELVRNAIRQQLAAARKPAEKQR